LAFVLLVVLTFLGLVWSRTLLDEGAFRLAELETRLEQETVRNRLLRLEVARLENPDRVASLAEPLGLFYPTEVVHIEVPGVADQIPGFDPSG
jgi:cell division protein FtsL